MSRPPQPRPAFPRPVPETGPGTGASESRGPEPGLADGPTKEPAVTGRARVEPAATRPTPLAVAGQRPPEGTVTYVFAVTRTPSSETLPPGAVGHEGGGPLRVLRAGALALIVQDVPAEDFGEAALTDRFNDPYQLERCARAHHRGVHAAAGLGPVVPLPLATLYLSDRNATEAVAAREAAVHALLDRLEGRTEWAVKVHLAEGDGDGPREDAPAAAAATEDPPAGGRAYLSRASARRRAHRVLREDALARAHEADLELRRHAVAATRHRLQNEQLTGRSAPQLLNAAYLLDDGQRAAFGETLERLRADERYRGLEIDESGPWIPYSFARLDEAPQGAEGTVDA
ncbi:GvpL/GvpF family gas vesicle protein [Streptomyces sp. NPDC005301]|uniref:GvpL/GvpF family gas vesicle protein n=1 Tax=Streptomyces sp. NPDC005301 TaxID=3156874 RepID=UPI0033B9DE29